MLNRPKRNCLKTTADILNSLKEGSDSGSMIFCMAAIVSVLLLQKELEEDLTSATPATRYSLFSLLCVCVVGFAVDAYRKTNKKRAEKIEEAERSEEREKRSEDMLKRIEILEATVSGLKARNTVKQNLLPDWKEPTEDSVISPDPLRTPLLQNSP